jgi:hypothetical protein
MTMTTRIPSEFAQTSERQRSVVDLLDSVLASIVDFYAQENIPLPERRYWTTGEAAADCAQLVVVLIQTYLGVPGGEGLEPAPCHGPRTAVMGVQILRKAHVPQGANAADANTIQTMSVGTAVDSWALMDAIRQLDEMNNGVVVSINTQPPSGGLQGILATVALQIP